MNRNRLIVGLVIVSVAVLVVTILSGVRHDYGDYLRQWDLVLAGLNPWSGNNAYGPLHNVFAWTVPLHALAPKVLTATSLLVANGLLVVTLAAVRPFSEWRDNYLIAFALNALVLISAFWFGLNDGLVAALIIGAVLARHRERFAIAGILLGLAALDKYYPALLIPFFALHPKQFQHRVILAALMTIFVGLVLASWLWGAALLQAIGYNVSRDATILSILRPIAVLGRQLGIGDTTDLLVKFNSPLVIAVWIGAFVVAWRRRENWLIGACLGFFAVLLTYKVGNPQFWVSWLALVATLPLLNTPEADRLARLSWPYAIFLTIFEIGYVVLQPQYYQGQWLWVNDVVGVPSFGLGVWMLWSYLRVRPGEVR